MSAITTIDQSKGGMLEQVLIKGDLSSLTPDQRSTYYMKVCESVGLNMLTKPFEYITLNGKLTLYALRACTDQLRTIHNVSVEEMTESEREGVFIVTVKVRNGEGRTDMAKGAVNISGLKGENLANALMKTETKAKRRATLSICGLGMLDESEVETIASAIIGENTTPANEKPAYTPTDTLRPYKDDYVIPAPIKPDGTLDFDSFCAELEIAVLAALDVNKVSMLNRSNAKTLKAMQIERPDLFTGIGTVFREQSQKLS